MQKKPLDSIQTPSTQASNCPPENCRHGELQDLHLFLAKNYSALLHEGLNPLARSEWDHVKGRAKGCRP